jgi:hypothetical protein
MLYLVPYFIFSFRYTYICYTVLGTGTVLSIFVRYTVLLGRIVADLACITDTKRTTMADDLDIDALLEAPYDKVGNTLGYEKHRAQL